MDMGNAKETRLARIHDDKEAQAWGRELAAKVQAVLREHPGADPENVRHTLILLEYPPLERLGRSLLRGRALAKRK
jgi:hypothetical protein